MLNCITLCLHRTVIIFFKEVFYYEDCMYLLADRFFIEYRGIILLVSGTGIDL